jgi:hypothetical protein
LNGVVLGIESLDKDAAGKIAAAGPARDLREQLEGTLGGAEIGQIQRGVSGHDPDQCDAMEIVSLGKHLRADKNIQRSGSKRAQGFLKLALGASRVAIEAGDASAGKFLTQALF